MFLFETLQNCQVLQTGCEHTTIFYFCTYSREMKTLLQCYQPLLQLHSDLCTEICPHSTSVQHCTLSSSSLALAGLIKNFGTYLVYIIKLLYHRKKYAVSTVYIVNCILTWQIYDGPAGYIDSSYPSLLRLALTEDIGSG